MRITIQKLFSAPGLSGEPDNSFMISVRISPGRRSFRLMLPMAALLALAAPAAAGFTTGAGSTTGERPPHARDPRPSVFDRIAQSYPQGPERNRSREVSDQEHAKSRRESGQNRSFEELYGRASAVGRGEYLGVEPDISRNIYRFKFMRSGGNVIWVDMDGRTGKVISARQ